MLVWSTLDHTGVIFVLKLKITLLAYVQHEQFQTGPAASILLDLQTTVKHFIYSHLQRVLFYFLTARNKNRLHDKQATTVCMLFICN